MKLHKSANLSAALLACCIFLRAAAPAGWFMAGSRPSNYETGTDPEISFGGHTAVYLKAKGESGDASAFGTLMQQFVADQYRGKRVRFSGVVKSDQVKDWAGLWMRIDKGSTVVGFDNMQDRAIKSSSDWTSYSVVLDVPKDATGIAFGLLLAGGAGQVWLSNVSFEEVGTDIPVTGSGIGMRRDRPSNLDFEKR